MDSNREAVIAIQGGGVYALSLLGQAKAVLDHGYIPLAFAGTSGGAILASLLWSGLSPQQIQDEFTGMVTHDPAALLSLLSPFEAPSDPHFDYAAFLRLQERVKQALASIPATEAQEKPGWIGRATGAIPGLWRAAEATFDAWGLWKQIQPHIRNRGLFRGEKLEQVIDDLIRKGLGDRVGLPPKNDPITFGHVHAMMKSNRGFYRPPLLLTATNLSRRRLELINSVEERYHAMPIAAAVRASAGFPLFFRPRAFGDAQKPEWFVDGGMISNFPIWTFSDAFREQISKSEFYSAYAWRPWLRIGLRVVGDVEAPENLANPDRYFVALMSMLAGGARNELEEILVTQDPRSIVIKQFTSNTECPGVLAVGEVDAARIGKMVDLGECAAALELKKCGAPGIYTVNPDLTEVMSERLRFIVQECERVMGDGVEPRFRANIFIPVKNSLAMLFSHNMENDDDDKIQFPDLSTGVTGACYQLSTTLVCNLEKVAQLRATNLAAYNRLFNMTDAMQNRIKKDRTWLMSVPIFDPHEVKVLPQAARMRRPAAIATCDLGIGLRGPLLGVLNIDAAWNYGRIDLNPDPDLQSADSRIRAISAIMQAGALTIGSALTT
ncbi:patatin-like phospholipase family protein [Bradyrhizobium commune]|uniref:Patatin-like phospholipase family protein n=1 Tax=Bradyrhizobium commune TaxID=83627 RepID=A0A7S9DAB2_9BRAD|nr:patatin-like phospholipase family protein [Bradyrhizobium commune]QPF93319.1 patatin-like phospholipase family protein [Bradyrhizobium commune]